MSRWGRGRGGSVAVPLDSALFRENSNCPTAARSAGTVGKWGITSFTSIRSAPYAYGNNILKKTVQDQNSPLTVPAVDTEAPPPKPKKFFKSRNAEPCATVPQITYAPPVPAAPLSPEHPSHSKEKKTKRSKSYRDRDSSSPELPKHKSTTSGKGKKTTATAKTSKKEDGPSDEAKPPNKRYLVRNRDKVINYAEDGSNSPIPEFPRYESIHAQKQEKPPELPSPKASPSVSSPTYVKPSLVSPSPSSKDGEDRKPPPIVLRISKGTSRIVSTDSNEGFTSPSSDRHSSLETHTDFLADQKKSPSTETICSPKHEGLKITIKCSGLTPETKKEKKKDKKDHKSHKRHHKNTDDDLGKKKSPLPGSDANDLYRTLASPAQDEKEPENKHHIDEIESQLAQLDSTEPTIKSPRLEVQPSETLPAPKPPERSSGRSRRNRPNVNYNENDDYLDAVTSKKLAPKTVAEVKRESRRGRKKNDVHVAETATTPVVSEGEMQDADSHLEKSDLIDILSGASESAKSETESHKQRLHKKHKHKHSSPSHAATVEEASMSHDDPEAELANDVDSHGDQQEMLDDGPDMDAGPDSPDRENFANDNSEEEMTKGSEDVFKPPPIVSDSEGHSEDKPSVKLVITKKKGSIFKSKSLVSDCEASPLPARKRRHLYRHEWANDKGNETPRPEPEQSEASSTQKATTAVTEELTRVTRYRSPDPIADIVDSAEAVKPYTSVKCAKEAKEYYTVVRNVKKAHQIQEIGEFQEFNDDIEYILDALQDNNPISTRCLSAITLATKCTAPAFRMHLRAHGTVQKFFSALHDATNDQSLGLCTATVMFVLSQDRLNMDLDRESLELMLNLLESDVSHKDALDDCGLTSAQLAKTQQRVRDLCADIKSRGKASHLDLDNITVGHLAMETLLSLTSKRAGEWFKEELRVLGGVEHIVRTIRECARRLPAPTEHWAQADVDLLRKADRCMRVLENVTQQNEENQLYLVSGERADTAPTLGGLLALCAAGARTRPPPPAPRAAALLDAALPAIKVLVNLSHSFGLTASLGANVVGEQVSVMETCLVILNNQGNFIPEDRNFEFTVCVLLLLINLVQNNESNTMRLLNIRVRVDDDRDIMAARRPALDLVVDLFYRREQLAKQAEENTDALLDGDKASVDKNKKQSQDDIDETVAKLLARAGTHMEHTMAGAYMALLLGHAAESAAPAAAAVRARVPRYAALLPTLRKYYAFLSLTASGEPAIVAHVKATHKIIKFMEASDEQHAAGAGAAGAAAGALRARGGYSSPERDVPQDMSINNLTYNTSHSSSGDDRLSSAEPDGYH